MLRYPAGRLVLAGLAASALVAVPAELLAPRHAGHQVPLALAAILALLALAFLKADGAKSGEQAGEALLGRGGAATPESPAAELDAADEPYDDLIRERDAALAASAAKSRYLASVSHELRTPLNAIYGYAQLMERETAVSPRDAAKIIRRSTEYLSDLVEGLLDMAMAEQGALRVARDVVRLPAFLDQIARMFEPQAAAKGLAFRIETQGRLPEFVRADQKRLRQILINLVGNAIKYTPAGAVTVTLSHAGEIATFEVRDTGPGIPEASHEHIFTPFERGAAAGSSAEGSGLGLAITRAIVHVLGGDIALESVPGAGSVFRVRLMLTEVSGHHEAAIADRRVTGYSGPRRRLLVMDDDVQQLAFMAEVLGGLGFDVATAVDGTTALALHAAQAFDLVLLDIAVPGRSGWDIAAELRALMPDEAALRIVMLSGNAHERHGPLSNGPVSKGRALKRGDGPPLHDLFLVKPVEIGALVSALGAQLGLDWIFENDEAAAPEGSGRPAAPPFPGLPDVAREPARRLRELLRIGHVRGIEAEIRALEAAAPEAASLVAALYLSLDRFDLAAMARQLEGV